MKSPDSDWTLPVHETTSYNLRFKGTDWLDSDLRKPQDLYQYIDELISDMARAFDWFKGAVAAKLEDLYRTETSN